MSIEGKSDTKEPSICIKPPPPPPAPLSPINSPKSGSNPPPNISPEESSKGEAWNAKEEEGSKQVPPDNQSTEDVLDDDFGDFQIAV